MLKVSPGRDFGYNAAVAFVFFLRKNALPQYFFFIIDNGGGCFVAAAFNS